MLKVWGRRSSFNLQKVMWLVGELGLPHEHIPAGGDFGLNDTPEFLAMNPHGRVPVIDDDGTVVWESQTILRYLAAKYGRGRFWSDDPGERSLAERWMDWSQASLQADFLMGVFWGFYRTPEAQRNTARGERQDQSLHPAFPIARPHPRRSPVLMRRQPHVGRYSSGHFALSVFRDRYRTPVRAECRSMVSAASGAPCLSGTHHGAIRRVVREARLLDPEALA
jgi:glutathione S-transferase